MNSLDILNNQISTQIEGKEIIEIHFPNTLIDYLTIYAQRKGNDILHFVEPPFCKAKLVSKAIYDEITASYSDEYAKDSSHERIDTEFDYDDFYNKYYNNI